ncbi:MAG TPA: membrane protein insertase YidC, partial [Pyrinomonadaceae bacterium]|nr:membrane protein insertase YidC [Pyrinomonadaceae bacterium]
MQQRRFVLALIISAAILFGWSFIQRRYYPVQPQSQSNANTSTAQQPTPSPSAQATDTSLNQQAPQTAAPATSSPQDVTPPRTVSIKTPLYEVKLNNRGAVATSWILRSLPPENGSPGRALHSVASTKENPQPLELIPQGTDRGYATLQIVTGDDGLDPLLASRNYQLKGAEAESGDVSLDLGPGRPQQQTVEFILQDAATGLSVVKN